MTVAQCLSQATDSLQQAGIGTARLDSLVLLEDVTGIDRVHLLAGTGRKLSTAYVAKFNKLLKRRAQHEPLAYIRGWTEFYGRSFVVSPAVLEPRPESETMIEVLKALVNNTSPGIDDSRHWRIADVGTGSGALGITAALELPGSQIELLDIDPKALKIAKINVDKLTSKMAVIESDLLHRASHNNDILLCNLPYVPDDYQINLAAAHEPRIAIFGGSDGLDVYRRLFTQVAKLSLQPLYILAESLPPQHLTLETIAAQAGYSLVGTEDFIGVFTTTKTKPAQPTQRVRRLRT